MDEYFVVKWKEHIIGFLARIDNVYYTRFQIKHLSNKKIEESIIKQTSFYPNKLYIDSNMFEFFHRRLRVEEGEDVFTRIRKTGGKRPTDNYSLEEMDEKQKLELAKILKGKIVEKHGDEKIRCEY